MQGRFGHEGMFRRHPEIQELIQTPEQIFDSDRQKAESEHRKVMERLITGPDILRRNATTELRVEHAEEASSTPPTLEIAWSSLDSPFGALLTLHPLAVGKGPEGATLGYTGSYGLAARYKDGWKHIERRTVKQHGLDIATTTAHIPEKISLDELFGVPEGQQAIIKPTATRWAVGQDELSLLLGEDKRTMYMGLGFLLLPYGHRYMVIGMHEGGHLYPQEDSPNSNLDEENSAWAIATDSYRQIHNLDMAKAGGQFDLLRQQAWYETKGPTMEQIIQFGLVSHYLGDVRKGNPHPTAIPEEWRGEQNRTALRIMEKFEQEIERAHTEYRKMTS